MNQFMQMQGLMPLLPEAILAIGAMVMLMVGVSAFQSERSSRHRERLLHRDPGVRGCSRS